MTIGVILSLLVGGLALLLARETKLRRALQSLCNRLLNRLSETSRQHFPPTHTPTTYRHRPRRR
jgi:hypothetical protein